VLCDPVSPPWRQENIAFVFVFLELDDNVASVLSRIHILERGKGVLESENLLVNDWLEVDLVLCEEITQILLVFCRSNPDTPGCSQ